MRPAAWSTRVADELPARRGVEVKVFHDDTSHTQNENLDTIVNYHNAQTRDLDVSVHFNAYVETAKPMGVEVLYVTQSELACADVGGDRGVRLSSTAAAKSATDLFFLNNTEMPAILIEVCFVDLRSRLRMLRRSFRRYLHAIANVLGGG